MSTYYNPFNMFARLNFNMILPRFRTGDKETDSAPFHWHQPPEKAHEREIYVNLDNLYRGYTLQRHIATFCNHETVHRLLKQHPITIDNLETDDSSLQGDNKYQVMSLYALFCVNPVTVQDTEFLGITTKMIVTMKAIMNTAGQWNKIVYIHHNRDPVFKRPAQITGRDFFSMREALRSMPDLPQRASGKMHLIKLYYITHRLVEEPLYRAYGAPFTRFHSEILFRQFLKYRR
jgi:hypothetical protein